MPELEQSARLFQASARLQRASNALERLASQEEPNEQTIKVLKWAREFLTEVDLEAGSSGVSGALAVEATTARPTYYMSITRLRPYFEEAGVRSRSDFITFLAGLFSVLLAGGRPPKPSVGAAVAPTSPDRVRLGARLLRELSSGLLAQNETHAPSVIR
jgi:hypothetical protein